MKDYLLENFSKLKENEIVDFFISLSPNNINAEINNKKYNYLNSLCIFVLKCMNFHTQENKIYTSLLLPNVRFHYTNIIKVISFSYNPDPLKQYINLETNFDISLYGIVSCLLDICFTYEFDLPQEINKTIVMYLKDIHMNYGFIYSFLFGNKNILKKMVLFIQLIINLMKI